LGRGYRRVKRTGHDVVVLVRQPLIGAHHHHALGHTHGRYRTGSRLIRRRLNVIVVELSVVVVIVVQLFLSTTAAAVIAAKVVEFVLDNVGPMIGVVQVLVAVVLMVVRVVVRVFACARGRFHGRQLGRGKSGRLAGRPLLQQSTVCGLSATAASLVGGRGRAGGFVRVGAARGRRLGSDDLGHADRRVRALAVRVVRRRRLGRAVRLVRVRLLLVDGRRRVRRRALVRRAGRVLDQLDLARRVWAPGRGRVCGATLRHGRRHADHGSRRARPLLVVLPAPGPVLVVGVFLHVDHPQPFSFLHVRPTVLWRQTSPFFS